MVRAVFFTVQETGQWLGGWTPWYGFTKLPEGVVFRLPAGSHVVADIHYQHIKDRIVDRGRLGIVFDTRGAKATTASDLALDLKGLRAETTLSADTTVLALDPEMAPEITSLEVKARRADGGTDVLLFAKDFSPKWPTPFVLAEPILLRRGTVLSAIAHANDAGARARLRILLTRQN